MLAIITAVSAGAAGSAVGLNPAPFQIAAAAVIGSALACIIVLWVKTRRSEDAEALFMNMLQQIVDE